MIKPKSQQKRQSPLRFPDPRDAGADGLVAVGGDLETSTLLEAYSHGIFPWPHDDYPLLWFSPDPRGVLDFEEFHVPRSLKKWAAKHSHWNYTVNKSTAEVIKACQGQKRPGQDGTWITNEIVDAYCRFAGEGYVKSLECWDDEELIGGIYGVQLNQRFSGESMFYRKPNASKMCVWRLVEHLQGQGQTWMDIQMVTPVTASFGGKYIPREEFLSRIETDP